MKSLKQFFIEQEVLNKFILLIILLVIFRPEQLVSQYNQELYSYKSYFLINKLKYANIKNI